MIEKEKKSGAIKYYFSGLLLGFLFLCSCHKSSDSANVVMGVKVKVVIDPSVSFQNMIGFGGAFAWYCDRVTSSSQKDQITTLLFQDLGADIIRFKNWYYPDGYPTTKTTTSMSDDNSKIAFDATNQLYTMAKQANPNVKILLSSWGPPAALKSNASSRQGTLKKDASQQFMYDAFADYWVDILDHLPFTPDYISIQNEPSYVNAGWTTCEWAPTETSALPGYDIAFDKVYQKILGRTNPPILIGPESANIGNGASGNTFSIFADVIKNKSYLGIYAYHPYNFTTTTTIDQTTTLLQLIGSYSNKPNLMTEYADNFSWFVTAAFINNALIQANSSGYIYWKMTWATPTDNSTNDAMISVNATGDNFTVTPFYYVLKHFAKHIDAGYKRVGVSSDNPSLQISAFINPAKNQLTLVMLNLGGATLNTDFEVLNSVVKGLNADQSSDKDFYKKLNTSVSATPLTLPGASITTVTLDI